MGRWKLRSGIRRTRAVPAALILLALAPAVALAHPLGNFTINHYAEVRVEGDRVLLDIVIDQAEIPAFQARQAMDLDGDGQIADDEAVAGAISACRNLTPALRVTADGSPLALTSTHAGATFPPGTGGLSTLRLVCGFAAPLVAAIGTDAPVEIAFADESFAERIGWREIVVTGSGVTVSSVAGKPAINASSVSDRLTAYPDGMLAAPLAQAAVRVEAIAGGPSLPPLAFTDATPLPGITPTDGAATPPTEATDPDALAGVLGGETLPDIFRTSDVTPFVIVLSLVTAAGLGAGHALTPGHGKALMAAYLVGTRGTWRHALGLGLAVSLSHTVGILVLAMIVVGAADILPPDLVVRVAPIVAAISILAIGGWMLIGEWRRRRAVTAHEHDHAHGDEHARADEHEHEHARADEHEHEHSHGGVRHSHAPSAGTTISWRGLFVLGLAGGLIPSTSALLILLGTIAAGRPGFGFVLVVAFGLGMAAVMGGVGLATVFARDRLDSIPDGRGLGRIRATVPLAAAVLVFGFGIYLTVQALTAAPTL
jgi:ABC-type nickel/cobalt efflux system permease component RcnA